MTSILPRSKGRSAKKLSKDHLNLRQHILDNKDCHLCPIANLTTQKVFLRGNFPAEIVFVGEAPGLTEDSVGIPFVGRSGNLLDHLIETMKIRSYAIVNSVLCTPYEESKTSIRAPTKTELKNCSGRLAHFLKICKPKGVIAVGKKAEAALKLIPDLDWVGIYHPSFILRNGGLANQKGLLYFQKNVLILEKYINELSEKA